MVKNLPAVWETWVRSLGWEDPLEEVMATQSSILAWTIPHVRSSLVGYSPRGCEESDMTERLSTKRKIQNKMQKQQQQHQIYKNRSPQPTTSFAHQNIYKTSFSAPHPLPKLPL